MLYPLAHKLANKKGKFNWHCKNCKTNMAFLIPTASYKKQMSEVSVALKGALSQKAGNLSLYNPTFYT